MNVQFYQLSWERQSIRLSVGSEKGLALETSAFVPVHVFTVHVASLWLKKYIHLNSTSNSTRQLHVAGMLAKFAKISTHWNQCHGNMKSGGGLISWDLGSNL